MQQYDVCTLFLANSNLHADAARYVWLLAYSPDGWRIIFDSYEKTIRIWDANTGAAFGKPLEGNAGFGWSVACTPDGRRTISGPNDKTNRVRDLFSIFFYHSAPCTPVENGIRTNKQFLGDATLNTTPIPESSWPATCRFQTDRN